MSRQIFVNLPVKDLNKTVEFFTKLGFTFNPQFTSEDATCMVVADNIFVMLLVEKFFKSFISTRDITDSRKSNEVIIALSADSRQSVDEMADKALANGGTQTMAPQDHGWMYSRSFQDVDGHLWEVAYMDITQFPKQ